MANNKKIEFKCVDCNRIFDRKYNLDRHIRVHQQKVENVVCSECPKTFSNVANLKVHFNDAHKGKKMTAIEKVTVRNEGKKFVKTI